MNLNQKTYRVDGRTLQVSYFDLDGVNDILGEIFNRDVYGLSQLKNGAYSVSWVVDVGAHMGFFGKLVHHYWPQARIISIEPDLDLTPCIVANCGPNWIAPVAVRYDQKRDYYVSPKTGGSMIYDPTVNFCDSIPNQYQHRVVECKPLELVNDWLGTSPVDILKLDCEGSEIDILCGMGSDLRSRIRRIMGEYHHIAGYRFIEKILEMKFGHLKPAFRGVNPEDPISMFEAA